MYSDGFCKSFHHVGRVSGKVRGVMDLSVVMKTTTEPVLPVAKWKIRCKSRCLWDHLPKIALVEMDELELKLLDPG